MCGRSLGTLYSLLGETSSARYNIKHNKGVQNSIRAKTSSSVAQDSKQKTCNSNVTTDERRNERNDINRSFRKRAALPKFHFAHVFNPQERWQYATHIQPSELERISGNFQISSNKHAQDPRFSTAFRLAGQNRYFESILSHSNCCEAQKVFTPSIQEQTPSNDVPPFWLSHSSKSIRNFNQLDRPDAAKQRNSNCNIFGRLPNLESRQKNTVITSSRNDLSIGKSGVADKLCQINFEPSKMPRISGDLLGPMVQPQIFTTHKMSISQQQDFTTLDEENSQSERNTELGRPNKLRQLYGNSRALESSQSSQIPKTVTTVRFLSPLCSPRTSSDGTRMVVEKSRDSILITQSSDQTFPHNGRIREGMGSVLEQQRNIEPLAPSGEALPFQHKRNARRISCNRTTISLSQEYNSNAPKRQQNRSILYQKGGWLEVDPAYAFNKSPTHPSGQLANSSCGALYSGQDKLRSRSVITMPSTSRVASASRSNVCDLPEVGHSSRGSDGVQLSPRSPTICQSGPERHERLFPRCLQPDVELPSCVDFSSSILNTKNINSPELRERSISHCSSRVGEGVLDARPEEPGTITTVHHPAPSQSPSGHVDWPTSVTSQRHDPASVEMWGWSASLTDWTPDQIGLLKSGWRDSSIKTYHHAWLKWLNWCRVNNVTTPYNPSGANLARFLIDLYLINKLSYRTILVYKSAVSTLCNPDSTGHLSSNTLVKKALKAIANQNPKIIVKPPIWDIDELISWLLSNNPDSDNFYQCSRRAAILLLLCSGRRVHDLTLLAIDSDHCSISDNHIILWPKFGAKTDNSDIRQSGWRLSSSTSQPAIDPVYWTKKVIALSSERRAVCKVNNLFLTACGPPKAASRAVIAGWIRRTLVEAGINASAGSTRSAVASKHWALNMHVDEILARGNWRSQDTFRNHYCRVIRPSLAQTNTVSAMFSPIAN